MAQDNSFDKVQPETAQEDADRVQGSEECASDSPFADMTEEEHDSFYRFLERTSLEESPFDD